MSEWRDWNDSVRPLSEASLETYRLRALSRLRGGRFL